MAYWQKLGPGLTTGAADDDPSGIATYTQAGAYSGLRLLWLAPWTFPVMAFVQEMCARIGLVTGKGLAANIRENYPRGILYCTTALLFITNVFNLGADLGAMAQVVQLLKPELDFIFLVAFFAVVSLVLEIYLPYRRYAVYLKYLALVLFAYVAAALMADLDWKAVLKNGFLPNFNLGREDIVLLAAVIGTTISPYLFFWQTSQEVEEERMHGNKITAARHIVKSKDIRNMRVDVWIGMFVSNLVAFFIIAASAATLYNRDMGGIASIAGAAEALRSFAGNATYLLFAIGIIGTGLLTVPILAGSASYALAESFRWKEGLFRKLRGAYAFYGIITAATLIGFLINLLGFDPFRILIWSAVLNALITPIVLFFIVDIAKEKRIMGRFANSKRKTMLGWVIVSVMSLVAVLAIWNL